MEAVINNTYVENLEEGVEQIIQFFTSKIRYLGPLRADPQAAQRFSPSNDLDDVGPKGEYAGKDTANVLLDFYVWNCDLGKESKGKCAFQPLY